MVHDVCVCTYSPALLMIIILLVEKLHLAEDMKNIIESIFGAFEQGHGKYKSLALGCLLIW